MNIWPWSKIQRLEKDLARTEKFASACLGYIDKLEPDAHHVRMSGSLWIIRRDSTEVFGEFEVAKPRSSFKVEGLEL